MPPSEATFAAFAILCSGQYHISIYNLNVWLGLVVVGVDLRFPTSIINMRNSCNRRVVVISIIVEIVALIWLRSLALLLED